MTPEEVIDAALAPYIKSAKRREEAVSKLVDALGNAGLLTEYEVDAVEVHGARVPVEDVDAYGLSISLDAKGNAVRVSCPWGLAVMA
jgi:uncharacterized protein YaaQ